MPAYDINFINELSKTMTSHKLNSDVENYLNNILLDIKKPVYNIVPNFASNSFNKNQKNKNMRNYKNSRRSFHKDELDKDFSEKIRLDKEAINNYKINRIKDINNKSEHDMVVTNIRKILNKITDQNYAKLKNEFLCYYKSIFDDKKNLDKIDINKINIYIFDSLVYNNIIFNNLYSDLLYNLININSDFSDILNNYLEIFYNIYKFIKIPKSSYSYDEITEINKHNDKYKCLCRFYIYCIKVNLIPSEIINDGTSNLQQELLVNIKLEEKKEYNELLTQFLFLITSNFKFTDEKLIENFKYISNLKNNSYPSISNKIIFKHKDIVEKNL
tara:strand:+ start:5592 stop:6581 length:990 start_codon:yes stop_codon:yes gene_type:complete